MKDKMIDDAREVERLYSVADNLNQGIIAGEYGLLPLVEMKEVAQLIWQAARSRDAFSQKYGRNHFEVLN